jgi:glutaminyl-tRNA synthetase
MERKMTSEVSVEKNEKQKDFIREIVAKYVENGGKVYTRFPPEPNGYLHIGHAKAICIDFGIAEEFNGVCNLRMDDTNPSREDERFVEGIKKDIQWLGFQWENFCYASDYFEQIYAYALELIKQGKAFVCDQSFEEMRESRGTLTEAGTNSPYRERSIEENLDLFIRMRNGEFEDGAKTLRAKIDMSAPNINLRDPVMYRIIRKEHYRLGEKWCIYPAYDWAHGLEDSIEGITFSLCDLDFENHRPLYDWFLENLKIHHPRQIEFARLNLSYTVMSKRKLMTLVEEGLIDSWDDPRMPTLCGLRRRGYTPSSIRNFCEKIGVTKINSLTDVALLEHCLREDLNKKAYRVMGVLNPLKVIITNYPDDQVEEMEAINNPEDSSAGTRKVPFSKVLYIEKDDFMEDAPKKFFRLTVGREVRLRYAYFVTCTDIIKDENGEIVEIHCTYDPASKGGNSPDGRKVKGTIHWVSASHALNAEVRLYDRLFSDEKPDEGDYKNSLNPDSLKILKNCLLEPSLKGAELGVNYQFERIGYFILDSQDSPNLEGMPVFNRTVSLRDSWSKIMKKMKK